MKALRTLLAAVLLLGGAMTTNAQRMSIGAVQSNARFLTDRMAYTLGINDPFLIDEIYRINYDYIWGVNDYLDDIALGYYYDDYLAVCAARDAALRNLLGYTIWNRLVGYSYFYRPILFVNRGWHFSIYDYDRWGPRHFHFAPPRPIARGYVGGHFFHGMPHRSSRPAHPAPRHDATPHRHSSSPQHGTTHRRDTPTPHRGMTPRDDRRADNTPQRGSQNDHSRESYHESTPRSNNNMHSSSRNERTTPAREGITPIHNTPTPTQVSNPGPATSAQMNMGRTIKSNNGGRSESIGNTPRSNMGSNMGTNRSSMGGTRSSMGGTRSNMGGTRSNMGGGGRRGARR